MSFTKRTRAQESSTAIEHLYVSMRHMFTRGFYKPMGVSGETLRTSLLVLRPEIYGSIAEEKSELKGLLYVMDRLPEGIEQCQYINLTSNEGYSQSSFKVIVPPKRRRNCYRIDTSQMNIQITRGRSDIYDVLTHLTFLFIEATKIMKRVLVDVKALKYRREWLLLEEVVVKNVKTTQKEREVLFMHLGSILERTYLEVLEIYTEFSTKDHPDRFFHFIYDLGKSAINEVLKKEERKVTFSPLLAEELGHHIYGEVWANNVKEVLQQEGLIQKPIHIISANMHSVMNSLYAKQCLSDLKVQSDYELFELLSKDEKLRSRVHNFAKENGLTYIKDFSGANINVQLIDTSKINLAETGFTCEKCVSPESPVLIVMDYAFGEQAYETMEEILKPYEDDKGKEFFLDVVSISIMGKAGVLEGSKGDIMIPRAHIFEGTADNYPFINELTQEDFKASKSNVFEGSMITVLGTSLQNKDVLKFFKESTWNTIGLEMEGAHYQKAIQAASKIRRNISKDVKVRYAYYASDNPLKTGSTLASGGLGSSGVRPTYEITQKIVTQIFNS